MPTLISFLGKSQLDARQGYRTTRYRFPDGGEHETPYFGFALAKHLAADRVILIGTASSMWDVLVENVVGDGASEFRRLELIDAVRQGSATEDLLDELRPAIEAQLGCEVPAIVIGAGNPTDDQQAVLVRLGELLKQDEQVVIDVTHGFRHLAMLGLAAARYLSLVKKVRVDGLYYGALDMMREGVAPVVELSGLAHVQEWAEALAAYEASGDFARFAPLLERDGLAPKTANGLVRGWELLSVNNVHDAACALRPVRKALAEPMRGASDLFRGRLHKALRWIDTDEVHEKLRLLALEALRRDDFLRAAIFGLESVLARIAMANGADPHRYQDREAASQQLRQELNDGEHADWKRNAFWLLNNVRNAIAHGTRPNREQHAQLLKNPQLLRSEMKKALDRLTNTP